MRQLRTPLNTAQELSVRDVEAGGSNPLTPTKNQRKPKCSKRLGFLLLGRQGRPGLTAKLGASPRARLARPDTAERFLVPMGGEEDRARTARGNPPGLDPWPISGLDPGPSEFDGCLVSHLDALLHPASGPTHPSGFTRRLEPARKTRPPAAPSILATRTPSSVTSLAAGVAMNQASTLRAAGCH